MSEIQGIFYLDQTPVTLKIENGMITKIIRCDVEKNSVDELPYIAPGIIDVQLNGFLSIGFNDPDLTVANVSTITRDLYKEGATSYLATIVTSSHEVTKRNCAVLAQALKDPEIRQSIPGIFLEGPYISPVDGFRGAHNKKWVRSPDIKQLDEYIQASENSIVKIGLAPEINGNMELIEHCVKQGIIVALAHHNGSAEIIKQAIDAGAVVATHLGNGCANTIHRHDNPLWMQLADDRIMATIIADGHHLRPEELQVFYKAKGAANLMLISDVTKLAGIPPGEYNWDGKTVVITPEGMIKYPEQNVLAGAALPVRVGIGNMMKYTQCSLADAIRMASRNQARLLDLNDRGEIAPGKRADLILFTIQNHNVAIQKTIVAGKVVYDRN